MTGAFTIMNDVRIPRRRRSAVAASRPRQEEEPGASPAASRDVGAAVAGKKQPSSSHSNQDEKQQGILVEEPVGAGGDLRRDVSDSSPATPSRNDGALAPSSASSKESAPLSCRGAAAHIVCDDAEELRRLKEKMPAVDGSPHRVSAAGAPAGSGKLMGDAIRCYSNNKPVSCGAENNKKRKDRGGSLFWFGMGSKSGSTSSAGSDMDVSLDKIGVVDDKLHSTLRGLRVHHRPVRAYGKMMTRSDRVSQQTRLLMSCKSWRAADGPFPLDEFMTEEEKATARGDSGLEVLALDRAGEIYEGMKCKYLESNSGYRIIGKWGSFLTWNGLVVKRGSNDNRRNRVNDVMIDLWLFRSSPGGKIGIVFVHYRKGDATHADAAFDEEMGKKPQKSRRRGTATEAASSPEGDEEEENEDVSGDDEDVYGESVAMLDEGGGGNDVIMEDAAYDAVITKDDEEARGQGEASTLPSSGRHSKGVEAVTLAPEEAGAQGKASSSPSPLSVVHGVKAAEVSAPLSPDARAKGEEIAPRSMVAEPLLLLSGCKQDVEAAYTLLQISQGF